MKVLVRGFLLSVWLVFWRCVVGFVVVGALWTTFSEIFVIE